VAGPVSLLQTELITHGAVLFGDNFTFDNCVLNHSDANFTVSLVSSGENSKWDINDGNLILTGSFTMTRCDINVNGTFGTPSAVTLTDSDMSVSGTYACAVGLTTLQRASKLTVTGAMSAAAIDLLSASQLIAQNLLTCTSSLTIEEASQTVVLGRLSCTLLNVQENSRLMTADFDISSRATIEESSTWVAKAAAATSSINAGSVGVGLTILRARVDFSGLTPAAAICTIRGQVGFSAAISVQGPAEFIWNNITVSVPSADSEIGISYSGAALRCAGAPTNINGAANKDFSDQQGAFNNNQVIAGRTIFTGQHPGGVYSAVAVPTGTSSVQAI
jgi:hypothetical protein